MQHTALPESEHPKVFISYSHDSAEHQERVLSLADRLRQDGIDAMVDQYAPTPPDGWPLWMDLEIQKADFVLLVCTVTYLRRLEHREQPGKGRGVLWEGKLIYNLLFEADTPVQKFIPILLEGGETSNIPTALRGITHHQVSTAEGYEDLYRHLTNQPRRRIPELGKLRALPAKQPESYPASLELGTERKPPTSLGQRNRLAMLKRVRQDWIDGVLKQSMYNVARIELGLETKADAVEYPLNAIVQVPGHPPAAALPGMPIGKLFDDNGEALLILGAPGTGKTTLLLELAQELLNRAERDESHPIPVVFNLSSWAVRRQPLAQWLAAELNERSGVPKRLAQRWVEDEQVLPLLDGLDEVAADRRQACVETINQFRRGHGLLPIAVCSRIADYEALGAKLRLRNAVVVQPLTKSQVRDYLARSAEVLRPLRAVLDEDPSFEELLETPLTLWVAMLAYQNAPVEVSMKGALEQRRRRLFANFVDAMFKRRSSETRYTQQQSLDWLSWLASRLTQNKQTVFYLENLHSDWLSTRIQKCLSDTAATVANGLIFGLIFGLTDDLIGGLIAGLIFGLIGGLIGFLTELRPVEALQFDLTTVGSRVGRALCVGLTHGLIFGVIGALFGGLDEGTMVRVFFRLNGVPSGVPSGEIPRLIFEWSGVVEALLFALIFGLIGGLTGGLIGGLITLLTTEAVETRRSPNQGTRHSGRNALGALLLVGSIYGLILGLLGDIFGSMEGIGGLIGLLVGEPIYGLFVGLTAGMIGGGLFFLRHFALRLVLWLTRSAPLNYVRFLDYATERIFLRRVGGGYIFIHRMLLEYFAALAEPQKIQDQENETSPILS